MAEVKIERPNKETAESIYSNFDHVLDSSVQDQLLACLSLYAQHAAWDFEGSIWFLNGIWYEDIRIYHQLVDQLLGTTVMAVIDQANSLYGSK